MGLFQSCGDTLSSILKPKDQNRFSDSGTTTATAPERIEDLRAGAPSKNSVDLVWTTPSNSSATAISDYKIFKRKKSGSGLWVEINDGVSTDTFSTITGLDSNTVYQFRVYASNGNLSIGSNIVDVTTLPNFAANFNSAGFAFINTGGATMSRVVAISDGTSITLNGANLVTLNKGQTHQFVSAQWDALDASDQVYVSGGNGNANIPWVPVAWAGKTFVANEDPTGLFNTQIFVYALEDAAVSIFKGTTELDAAILTAGQNTTFTISQADLGSFQIKSLTGFIVVSMMDVAENNAKAIPPAGYDIIGFPSQSAIFSTLIDFNDYEYYHSGGTNNSGNIDGTDYFSLNAEGTATLYRSEALLVRGSKMIGGASYNDGNGNDSAAFLPTSYMKKKYVLNVKADYVMVASIFPATVQVYDSSGNASGSPVVLSRTGSGISPYYGQLGAQTGGISFVSDYPIAAWYQPDSSTPDAGSVASDVTIMFGSN